MTLHERVRSGSAQAPARLRRAEERCIHASRLGVTIALSALFVASSVARARAQTEARAGSGLDALPGVHEVPFAVRDSGWKARLGAGYGWTESVLEQDDTHHRVQVDAAFSFSPLPWLSTALRVLGRYDAHTGGVSDSGALSQTHAIVRAMTPLGAGWFGGSELGLYLPAGDTVGSALSALSGDLLVLLSYAPELSPLTFGIALGLRADRSKHAGGEPERYSGADRLALGASDAILAAREGVAFSYRTGVVEWVTEWAFRMYFARIAQSPMWFRAGARYRPTERLQLELLAGVSPSARPSLDEDAPLAVVEPRLAVGLSVTYGWLQPTAAGASAAAEVRGEPAAQTPASVRGQVLTPSGTALAGARVTLRGERAGTEERAADSDAQGRFAFADLPAGAYELNVAAEGFIADRRPLTLRGGDAPELSVTLGRELPQGQIRGTVRRFNGAPVVASITVAELDLTAETKRDGSFEIDVPPGDYSVAVKARGFRPQTRRARVSLHGVAILVVELEAGR